jgi:hypothetical protein
MSENELAVKENKGMYSSEQVANANLDTQKQLPDLSQAKKHFVPLSIEYWTPATEGEEKLVYIHSVGVHEVPDMDTGEIKQLECVMFLEKDGDVVKRWINAGRVLVGNIRDAMARGEIVAGTTLTPVSITYMGKRQNSTNARISNCWQIIPLINQPSED